MLEFWPKWVKRLLILQVVLVFVVSGACGYTLWRVRTVEQWQRYVVNTLDMHEFENRNMGGYLAQHEKGFGVLYNMIAANSRYISYLYLLCQTEPPKQPQEKKPDEHSF